MLGKPKRDRVAERREATRREIIDAAWQVAREQGLSQLTLRDVAARVGMKAPSLYSHVASKNAIYDAMFAQAWDEVWDRMREVDAQSPADAREWVRRYARAYFDYCLADPARFQLLNQRTIPGFEPSPEAYAPSVRVLEGLRERFARLGITADEDIDLYVAVVLGLADAQLANDPGGDRWARLFDRAIDMYLHDVGIPFGVATSPPEGPQP